METWGRNRLESGNHRWPGRRTWPSAGKRSQRQVSGHWDHSGRSKQCGDQCHASCRCNAGGHGREFCDRCMPQADVIIGPVGIVIADSMLGEITPAMAQAVGQSRAKRILIPVNLCDNIIVAYRPLYDEKCTECSWDSGYTDRLTNPAGSRNDRQKRISAIWQRNGITGNRLIEKKFCSKNYELNTE